jgi:hypothetical protein
MSSPRERVCRAFKNQEKKFLNYDSQKAIALGDIFFWDGWNATIINATSLKSLGVKFKTEQSKTAADNIISSAESVDVSFGMYSRGNLPTMKIKMRSPSCFLMQTYKSKLKSIDVEHLASELEKLESQGKIQWNKRWIVVTDIWEAEAYTRLVAGGCDARAGICAMPGNISNGFNIADTSLKVTLGYEKSLASQEIASSGAIPYIIGRKYRAINGQKCMIRYGGFVDEFISLL